VFVNKLLFDIYLCLRYRTNSKITRKRKTQQKTWQ